MIHNDNIYFPENEAEKFIIKCIWRINNTYQNNSREIILPKGNAEIIFNLSADDIYFSNPQTNYKNKVPPCFINGLNEIPFILHYTGKQTFIGLQLNVSCLKLLFNIPVKEFNNTVMDGSLICNTLNSLMDQLSSEKKFEGQIKLITTWLLGKLVASNHQTELCFFINLWNLPGIKNYSVTSFKSIHWHSDRHIRRLFNEWYGMNTTEFINYHKYLSALDMLHQTTATLVQVGLDAGFYDQSHFIKKFKALTNLTPKEYRQIKGTLPGHLFYSS